VLFNSYEFIFGFVPVTLAGFLVLGAGSRAWALRWLIFASLLFYAWWRPLNVLIIAPSIVINFLLARALQRLGDSQRQRYAATAILVLGILFNVAFLGYFKYIDFARTAINDAFGTNLVLTHIILPLGISFITFQKIAFLIDLYAKRVTSFTLQDYCLFVLFFPQLIAGPIVHYREMMPQFQSLPCRFDKENVAVGITLFLFGLFKKAVLADSIAPHVSLIYEHAAAGGGTSFFLAWMAAVGFTLQVYFDFSGYSDMALGLARLFGIRLPANFYSPLRASSIIDFWLHWHMTLTRFLTAYVFNPLSLALIRRRLALKKSVLKGPNTTLWTFVVLLMFPLVLTMFISGVWHGAGYTFLVFGLLHGFYLTINHGWRLWGMKLWPDRGAYLRTMKPVGFILTFVSVAVAMVFFRSSTTGSAIDLVKGMVGLNGVTLPPAVFRRLGPLADWLHRAGIGDQLWGGEDFLVLAMWIPILMFIVLVFPNTLQILARYEPALGVKADALGTIKFGRVIEWRPSLPWAFGMSVIAATGILFLGGPSEFLYWQF